MTLKTQFSGPVATGIDRGNLSLSNKSFGRFTVWTPLTTLPVTAQPVAVLPFDAVLHEINIWKTGAFTGEAAFKFGTATGGSDNLGSISISGNSVYRAFVNSATAQTTLPFAHAGVSANPTPIYFSTGAISGTTSALASAAFVEVIYTRISLTERPDLVAAHKGNDTTFQGPVRSGGQDVGIPSRSAVGNLVSVQQATADSSPVSGQVIGLIPYGACLKEINFYCRTAPAGEATVRFAINGETDNLGSVTVSAAGVYSVAITSAVRATVPLGINSGSGQPVRMSVLAASGSVAALQGMGELVMVRRGQSDGYPGPGQKETTFQGPIATGVNSGLWGNAKPEIGWGRFSKLTTTIPSTNGVVSGLLVGYLPIGAALVEINYIAGTAAGGEATVRAGTSPTVFTSDTLGAVSVSAAGIYSVISSTAVRAFDDSGVNRAKSGATAQAIYLNVAAASGSIATLSANAAVEIVYTRLDPSIYGV
jgi:hypothetical protein